MKYKEWTELKIQFEQLLNMYKTHGDRDIYDPSKCDQWEAWMNAHSELLQSSSDICSFYFSMSDSESSELVDSEAGLEEMEDEKLLSSDPEDNSNESSDEEELDEEENNVEEEFLEDSGEDEELSSEDEEEKKLTEDELRRIHLDDFSSDDEVWFEYC